jgi:sigma-B regulation protein RsbU (phosphoserine phosphatase)
MNDTSSRKIKRNITALVDFSRIINSSIDLQFILNNVLLTCLGKFLSTKGLIALNENGKLLIKHTKGLSDHLIEKFPQLSSNDDFLLDERLKKFMNSARLKAVDIIRSSDDSIGLVCLGEKLNKTEYTEDDLEFLKTILNISATAIQNSIRINELQGVNRELDSRIQRLNVLFELGKEFGLFSESTKVAKLLIFSVIGQFMVSKYAVLTVEGEDVQILESKFEAEELLKCLKHCDFNRIENSITGSELNEDHSALVDLGVSLIVPMQIQGRTKGLILLGKRINNQPFADTDIEFIYSVGSLAIISLENKRLFTEELEKQKLEEELDIAREIQQNLLPSSIPEYENFEIAAVNMSSKQVGGDYYDIIPLKSNKFCVAIADVSGKGAPASLMMANIQAFLQVICRQDVDIVESTGVMNDLIYANTTDGRFITFFWAVICNDTKEFHYVNAGHNPPLLIRNGKITKLKKGGIILGVVETTIPYLSESLYLQSDDVLVLFTDGISEALNKQEVEFSDEKLEEAALRLSSGSAIGIMEGIKKEVQDYAEGAPQSDDITMVVIKVK